MRHPQRLKLALAASVALVTVIAGAATQVMQDTCGIFTDVSPAYCPYVLELYYLGITAGTSPTTFSPSDPLTRGQAAVFISKGLNQAFLRSSRRAALGQWWTTSGNETLTQTAIGGTPQQVQSDGADLWVTNEFGYVSRVRASDGKLLESWNAPGALGILVAMGRVLVTNNAQPGGLYMIDPTQPAGDAVIVASGLGDYPRQLAFDGSKFWTANLGGSISIITPGSSLPWAVTTLTEGFGGPGDILFDGTNVWVAQTQLLRLDSSGQITQTIPVPAQTMAFDGVNLWCGDGSTTIRVVRAASGVEVATLNSGSSGAVELAFDGQRILVVTSGGGLDLYDAASVTFLGTLPTAGLYPQGVSADGINFWITGLGGLNGGNGQLARF